MSAKITKRTSKASLELKWNGIFKLAITGRNRATQRKIGPVAKEMVGAPILVLSGRAVADPGFDAGEEHQQNSFKIPTKPPFK